MELIPKGADQTQARETVDIIKSAKVFLFFGEIKFHKGLDLLIESMHKLDEKFENLILLAVGKPASEDDIPDFSSLENTNINVVSRLKFVPNSDVWQYFLASDLIALPYRQISQSGILFSAISHKRFVISTEVGEMKEIIDETESGITVPALDTTAFVDAIDKCLNDPELYQREKHACIKLNQLYSWEKLPRRQKTFINQIIIRSILLIGKSLIQRITGELFR